MRAVSKVCSSGGGVIRSSVEVTASKERWAWPSTMPGIMVMPWPSITVQSARESWPAVWDTARMRDPSTSTSPRKASAPVASQTFAPVISVLPTGSTFLKRRSKRFTE